MGLVFLGKFRNRWLLLLVEIVLVTCLVLLVKKLSGNTQEVRIICLIGIAISFGMIVGGELLCLYDKYLQSTQVEQSDLTLKVGQAENFRFLSVLPWLLLSTLTLFLGEVFNAWSFMLKAPSAERELIGRVVILVVMFLGVKFLIVEKLGVLQFGAAFLALFPAMIVLYESSSQTDGTRESAAWILPSVLMALASAIKRISGKMYTLAGLGRNDAVRFSGYLCLPLFLSMGLFVQEWPSLDYAEWLCLFSLFLLSPLIAFVRQMLYESDMLPTTHEALTYLGCLLLLFVAGGLFYPSEKKLSFGGFLAAVLFSAGAVFLLIKDGIQKKEKALVGANVLDSPDPR